MQTVSDLVGGEESASAVFGDAVTAASREEPEQTSVSLVARAAQKLGWGQKKLKKQFGVRVSRAQFRRAHEGPLKRKPAAGGRLRKIDSPRLTKVVRKFLLKHSKETSRFCRTKRRHQEVFFVSPPPG